MLQNNIKIIFLYHSNIRLYIITDPVNNVKVCGIFYKVSLHNCHDATEQLLLNVFYQHFSPLTCTNVNTDLWTEVYCFLAGWFPDSEKHKGRRDIDEHNGQNYKEETKGHVFLIDNKLVSILLDSVALSSEPIGSYCSCKSLKTDHKIYSLILFITFS